MFSKIHLEDICGIIYVYMISIPCLCKYMATWVGKFTMGPWTRARSEVRGGAQRRLGRGVEQYRAVAPPLAPRTSLRAPVLGPAHGPMVNLHTHEAMYLHKQGMDII